VAAAASARVQMGGERARRRARQLAVQPRVRPLLVHATAQDRAARRSSAAPRAGGSGQRERPAGQGHGRKGRRGNGRGAGRRATVHAQPTGAGAGSRKAAAVVGAAPGRTRAVRRGPPRSLNPGPGRGTLPPPPAYARGSLPSGFPACRPPSTPSSRSASSKPFVPRPPGRGPGCRVRGRVAQQAAGAERHRPRADPPVRRRRPARQRQAADEVAALARLIGRRPDAETVFRAAGACSATAPTPALPGHDAAGGARAAGAPRRARSRSGSCGGSSVATWAARSGARGTAVVLEVPSPA
jgi:hypothetical protein